MSMTRSLGTRLRSRDLGVFTWAELQATYPNGGGALAALPTGVTAFVSDWGAPFVPNAAKTFWEPIGKSVQTASAGSTIAAPLASVTGVTAGQFSIPGGAPSVPANLLTTGWRIRLLAELRRTTSTATATLSIRFGTAGTTSDSLIGSNASVASPTAFRYDAESVFTSNTGRLRAGAVPGSTDARLIGQSHSDLTTNVNAAAVQYLSFDISSANAADNFDLLSYRLLAVAP